MTPSAATTPGTPPTWYLAKGTPVYVSWLPGRLIDRNTAITAMTLAEVIATEDVNPGHRLWLHIEGWSAELGLTAPDALTWISQPPGRVSSEKEAVTPEDPEAAGA